ncbi:MAG: Rap1a/Tai family immunity protein [Gammaproteobacteria bacterium]|nr:Rap1a/Tai family immunity protein [Gammaproteobacteria bacterium]
MATPLPGLLGAILLLNGVAVHGAPDNGHRLLAECRAAQALLADAPLDATTREGAMYCLGYLRGVTRIVTIGHHLKPQGQLFCPPREGIRSRDAVEVLVRYLEAFPERLPAPRVTLVAAAFMRAWPCTPPAWPDGPPPVGLEDRWQP